jgi:glutamyl-tRNA synthetase
MAINNRSSAGSKAVVGRLAPSPTGGLHLGHARTFLIAWLSARAAGGRVILRIEDLDATRVRAESRQGILVDLHWMGLDWDEGPDVGGPHAPYVQSERAGRYRVALDRLVSAELVYPCTCTRVDIQRAASAPHPDEEGPSYPGTCSHRRASDADALGDRPFAWRFRVPPGPIAWPDLFHGLVEVDPARAGGDFIVARHTIGPSYQLAVVVDDAAMAITQVIRGADLITSTPRQVLLYQALGRPLPRFGHVPLALGPNGRRLAKRENALKIATLREAGVDPKMLVGSLIQSCGWSEVIVRSAPRDWIGRIELPRLSPEPWVVTSAWLEALGRVGGPRGRLPQQTGEERQGPPERGHAQREPRDVIADLPAVDRPDGIDDQPTQPGRRMSPGNGQATPEEGHQGDRQCG